MSGKRAAPARWPIPPLGEWIEGDWNYSAYGLPRYVDPTWCTAWSRAVDDNKAVVVVYTVRGWCAMLIRFDGFIERWTDADSGRANVGTCTEGGKARCIAAAERAVRDLQERAEVPAEAWLRRQLEGLGQ